MLEVSLVTSAESVRVLRVLEPWSSAAMGDDVPVWAVGIEWAARIFDFEVGAVEAECSAVECGCPSFVAGGRDVACADFNSVDVRVLYAAAPELLSMDW